MKRITVINPNPFNVVAQVNTNGNGYSWESANSPNEPTAHVLRWDEIEYIFNNGKAIQFGYLTFQEDEKQEIYESLGFSNYKQLLSIKDIENMILNADVEVAQRIINIDNMGVFERVRAVLIGLMSTRQYDISSRIIFVINKRYEELLKGQSKTDIIIKTSDIKEESDDVDKLKNELESMKELMAKLLSEKETQSNDVMEQDKSNAKRVGRPKKEN